jgi:mitochondrial enoyl-[acyl-carrier protein] reductase / trans-2-enoyl-CoA reductase
MQNQLPIALSERLISRQTGKPGAVLERLTEPLLPPNLAPGEVWVKIFAAPINPADLNLIEGTYGVKAILPSTPGGEGSGIVEVSHSNEFTPGDRVMFLTHARTWASHTTVTSKSLFKLPPQIDLSQAAMLKVNPATAWQLLHASGKPLPGDVIVQNAGNSAVGRCVIQLARDLGIRTISFVRRQEVCEELRALGADYVFLDNDDGVAAATELLGGATAARAFNAIGGESALRLMKLLRQGGSHITYGGMGRKPVSIPNGLLIFRDLQIRGLWLSRWLDGAAPEEVHAVYTQLAANVAAGKLIQAIDSTYLLEHFPLALARLESADRSGKILLVPSL